MRPHYKCSTDARLGLALESGPTALYSFVALAAITVSAALAIAVIATIVVVNPDHGAGTFDDQILRYYRVTKR